MVAVPEPSEENTGRRPRTDWREHLRDVGDILLTGIAVTVTAVPVLTLGAGLSTASAAIHDRLEEGSYPSLAGTWRRFVRGLLPGAGATVVAVAGFLLLSFNLTAASAGAVPGGTPLAVLTAVLTAGLMGLAALTVAEAGRAGGTGWRPAVRAAVRAAAGTWWLLPATVGVIAFVALLGWIVPVTVPLLPGLVLFAVHVLRRRAG